MKHTDPQDLQTTERPVEKLLELADLIEQNEDEFNMSDYSHSFDDRCGSPACVCGWWDFMTGNRGLGDCEETTAREMGLKRRWASEVLKGDYVYLFRPGVAYEALERDPTAADAAKVIRHFALTGQEDWSVAR